MGLRRDTNQVNPFQQITSGITTGLQFATQFRQLKMQQEQNQLKREQFEQQKQTQQLQLVDKFVSSVDRISKLPPKTGKAMLKNLQQKMAPFGLKIDQTFEAGLFDPEFSNKLVSGLQAARNIIRTGETSAETTDSVQRLFNSLGSGEFLNQLDKLQTFQEQEQRAVIAGEGRKAQLELQIASREKIAGERVEAGREKQTAQLTNTLNKQALAISKKDEGDLSAANIILTAADTGANDFQMLKAFNQFNDTARVTEGEMQGIKKAQGIIDRAQALAAGFKEGDILSPGLRNDIKGVTKRILGIFLRKQKSELRPIVNQANARRIPIARILTGDQRKLFKAAPRRQTSFRQNLGPRLQGIIKRAETSLKRKLNAKEIRKLQAKFGNK